MVTNLMYNYQPKSHNHVLTDKAKEIENKSIGKHLWDEDWNKLNPCNS